MNGGFCSQDENEREALDMLTQPHCIIQRVAERIQRSHKRIKRTSDKWKAMR
jgi:hypothetical protein